MEALRIMKRPLFYFRQTFPARGCKEPEMGAKLIAIEESDGPQGQLLKRVLSGVAEKDRGDRKLRRLVAFRLRIDGEKATADYLSRKAREALRCAYTGSLYDFIRDDAKKKECGLKGPEPDPPEVA